MPAPRGQRPIAAAVLAVAGYVDAVGFLSFHARFVSFASGSTAEIIIRGTRGEGGIAPIAALVGAFVGGVFAGAWAGARARRRRRPLILGLAALLVAVAALVGRPLLATLACMAAAMGLLNTVDKEARPGRTALTYATGTVVRLAEAVAERAPVSGWLVPLVLVLCFAGGVFAGTRALMMSGMHALWPVAGVLAGLSALTLAADGG